MTVRYHTRNGKREPTYDCQGLRIQQAGAISQDVPRAGIDAAIGTLLVELMTPLTLEVTLAVQEELTARAVDADRLRQQQVERARYEMELARRRYMHVDPANRLVAASLEAEWNEALRSLAAAQEAYERGRAADRQAIDEAQRAAEVRFARLFNTTPFALAIVDVAGRILSANASFLRLFGGISRPEDGERRLISSVVADTDFAALERADHERKAGERVENRQEDGDADCPAGGVGEQHRAHVTAWWAEVFGGPAEYTEKLGGYERMLAHHRGLAITSEQRFRFASLMSLAADDAGLPADPEFRAAFVGYLEWGTRLAQHNSQTGGDVVEHAPVPRWGWGVAPPYQPLA